MRELREDGELRAWTGDAVPVLWQLRTSIFSEKGRWAVDYKGLPHRRRDLRPGLHSLALRVRGRGTTAPVLDLNGRSIRDTTAIVAALEEVKPDPPLYPADPADRHEALELEDFFDEHCGHEVRRVTLDPILRDVDLVREGFLDDGPRLMRGLAPVLHPLVESQVRRRYGIDDASVRLARGKVMAAFDRIESQLRPSGYLVGDRFTVADLAGASLLAPVVMPPEYPDAPWTRISVPSELASFRDSLSDREGFRWVLEMYRRHRGRSVEISRLEGVRHG
jgi:glutathione S-transferase